MFSRSLAASAKKARPPAVRTYTRVPFASTTLGSEQPLISSELLGYGRAERVDITLG